MDKRTTKLGGLMVDNFELVKSRLSIRDVVEYYTGEHFNRDDKCHCPFPDHAGDKNPSFSSLCAIFLKCSVIGAIFSREIPVSYSVPCKEATIGSVAG